MRRLPYQALLLVTAVSAFLQHAASTRKFQTRQIPILWAKGSGEVGSGPNWIERSFPVDVDDSVKVDPKAVIDYDLGISGVAYQIGSLSKRLFEAIESRSTMFKGASIEVRRGFLIYTMDVAAKEAVRAALKQNGLELVLAEDEEEEGIWADIDTIKILDEEGQRIPGKIFDSWEEAVDHWSPGMGYDFVARQVPAKMRELSLDELLQALDPTGELRQQAKDAGMRLPDDEIKTLQEMADENTKRTEMAPRGATDESQAFAGVPDKRGYKVISASDLLYDSMNADGTENEKVLMHVMDAMVNHGCLIVDLTDRGARFQRAMIMASMWKTAQDFFDLIQDKQDLVPDMMTLEEVGSPHAKVGFGNYHGGNMQFLETRLEREKGDLYPKEARTILGQDGCRALRESFKIVSQIGKDIVRIVVGASTRETGALEGASAAEAAVLVGNELLDDGQPLRSAEIENNEGRVSMSPHRLCLYSNKQQSDEKTEAITEEIFGAHTDSTFVTAVPVASISGLEVFEEDNDQWYRPELAARRYWEEQRAVRGLDTAALSETVDGVELPWHARFVVCMPGELLQLCSRNEVMAAVHRVVATKNSPSRLSAPILLRGRPGIRMDAQRYLGGLTPQDSVIRECDGMTIEQIHDAMQPAPFQ